jgi:acyl carrier protein
VGTFEIKDAILDALVELGISAQIANETRLQSDLELDSTETVQLSLEMKRRFNVDIKLDTGQDLSVREVCELVEQALTVPAES